MLSVKARETADTIFNVLGMTQPRIKPSLPASLANGKPLGHESDLREHKQ